MLTVSCGKGSSPTGHQDGAPPTSSSSATDRVGTEPLTSIEFATDDDNAATVTITPTDGGVVTATGADGSTYELDVPPTAVAEDTEVTVVPLLDMTGGGGAPIVGARFEPGGLQFLDLVKLTIRPGTEIPGGNQYLFVANHDGSSVRPAFVDPRSKDATLYLQHFSTAGMAGVNDSDLDYALGVEQADRWAAINDQIAVKLGIGRQGTLLGGDNMDLEFVVDLMDRGDKEFIQPALDALTAQPNRCSKAKEVVSLALGAIRQRRILGAPETKLNFLQLLGAARADCEREAIRLCKQKRDSTPLLQFWLGLDRQFGLLGVGQPISPVDMEERAKRICVPQRYTASGGGNGVTITGTVPDIGRPFMLAGAGDGFAINLSYTPDDDGGRSGSMTYEGSGGGVPLAGSSHYVVAGEEGGVLTLTQTGSGCAADNCADGTEIVTLTPIP